MKRDDWMLFTLTFLTGLAIGMYVYIVAFKPTYAPETLSGTEAGAEEWSLISRQRGGGHAADHVLPSFRLLGDRNYVYLPGGQGGDPLEPREGRISSSLMRQVREYDRSLAGYSEPVSAAACASDQGGYDLEYRFTVDGVMYFLDTCHTVLGATPLAELLEAVWGEVEGRGGGRQFNSFSDWAQNWLRERIGVQP